MRGGRSENGPRLSLGNGATFGPKVTYFTVYFLAGSHRSRAAAPDLHESSIVSADPGCPGRDPKVHGKIRHFCHFGPCILDSVANSVGKLPNGARGPTKRQYTAWYFSQKTIVFWVLSILPPRVWVCLFRGGRCFGAPKPQNRRESKTP